MFSVNDKLNKKSNKLRQVTPLKNYIVDKIDNNQNVKRLCRYLTKTPLKDIGQDYNGKLIIQNDLTSSLKFKTAELGANSNEVLIPYMFNDEQENMEEQVLIFVHGLKNKFTGTVGANTFMIDILCPRIYNQLDSYGDERIYEIAIEIIDLFDGNYVDEEYQKLIGCYQFKVESEGQEWRVSGKNNIIGYSFPITVDTINLRTRD